MGSDFNASQDVIIPVGIGDSTRRKFPTLLGAMAQIQQFFVIEKSGQEIPDEFLTIQGKFNFFKVGCGSGFIEGLSFAVLAALVVPILSDQQLMMSLARYFPLAQSKVFLHTLNCFRETHFATDQAEDSVIAPDSHVSPVKIIIPFITRLINLPNRNASTAFLVSVPIRYLDRKQHSPHVSRTC